MRRFPVVQIVLVLQLLLLGGCSGEPVAPGPTPGPITGPGPVPDPNPDPIPDPNPDPIPDPLPDGSRNAGLWTAAGASPSVLRLAPDQLAATATVAPRIAVYTSNAELIEPLGVAFDRSGTLWVASHSDSALVGFPPDALARSAGTEDAIVIRPANGSLSGPAGLAFDAAGRLWVSNVENGTIVRYDPEQLAAGGTPVPGVVVQVPGQPDGLAFDAAGSLWVSDAQSRTISAYTPAQLAAAGTPAPAIVLSAVGASLANPRGIAFDAAGDLWVANAANRTVVSFTAAQLAASGAPAPHVVLSPTERSLRAPVGLAFDGEGNLWVMSVVGIVERFAATDLRTSGTPAAAVQIQLSNYLLVWGIAFWPVPAGLPIN